MAGATADADPEAGAWLLLSVLASRPFRTAVVVLVLAVSVHQIDQSRLRDSDLMPGDEKASDLGPRFDDAFGRLAETLRSDQTVEGRRVAVGNARLLAAGALR